MKNENSSTPKRLAFFDRYLTVWVLVCMVVGVAFGKWLPGVTSTLSKLEFSQGSQVNVPIGVLLWLMIYPMMLKVDFTALSGIARKPKGHDFIIDRRVDALCERDFVSLPRLHDRRADGSLMHNDQPMRVQPASCEVQQLLPIAGARQFHP